MKDNASLIFLPTVSSVSFAVKLFVNLGNVILVEKCSVKHASLTG